MVVTISSRPIIAVNSFVKVLGTKGTTDNPFPTAGFGRTTLSSVLSNCFRSIAFLPLHCCSRAWIAIPLVTFVIAVAFVGFTAVVFWAGANEKIFSALRNLHSVARPPVVDGTFLITAWLTAGRTK